MTQRDVPQIICRRKAATGSQKIGDGRVIQRAERKLVDRTAFGPVGEHADAAFASPVIVARTNVGLTNQPPRHAKLRNRCHRNRHAGLSALAPFQHIAQHFRQRRLQKAAVLPCINAADPLAAARCADRSYFYSLSVTSHAPRLLSCRSPSLR